MTLPPRVCFRSRPRRTRSLASCRAVRGTARWPAAVSRGPTCPSRGRASHDISGASLSCWGLWGPLGLGQHMLEFGCVMPQTVSWSVCEGFQVPVGRRLGRAGPTPRPPRLPGSGMRSLGGNWLQEVAPCPTLSVGQHRAHGSASSPHTCSKPCGWHVSVAFA